MHAPGCPPGIPETRGGTGGIRQPAAAISNLPAPRGIYRVLERVGLLARHRPVSVAFPV